MTLPRILVIDDLYGRSPRDRADLCYRAGMVDVTDDDVARPSRVTDPVAEAFFTSAQVETGGVVENDLAGAIALARAGWRSWPRWSLVLLDLHFATGELNDRDQPVGRDADRDPSAYFGLTILWHFFADPELKDIPVVILSSMSRADSERLFSEHGAVEFCDKTDLDRARVATLLDQHGLIESEEIVGRSVPLLRALREARRRARQGDNVVLLGETGTGKELLARYMHDRSRRRGRFVTLFTQAVPESLIEDELFGHERGAFTGANDSRAGKAELADFGTLFVDEFGEIPPSVQPKLLRLLDRGIRETQRIGGKDAKRLDLLVLAATQSLAKLDRFAPDVLYRVRASDPVVVPPLRERLDDIPLLARIFLDRAVQRHDAQPREMSADALAALQTHSWPGNVRELEDTIERAVGSYRGLRYLTSAHLRLNATPANRAAPALGEQARPALEGANTLDAVLEAMKRVRYDASAAGEWVGRYADFVEAIQHLTTEFITAHLEMTRRRTPESPDGRVQIHPAMKLLTGNPNLTAHEAADLVKKLISHTATLGAHLGTEARLAPLGETVNAAFEAASRLRPSKRRKPAAEPAEE